MTDFAVKDDGMQQQQQQNEYMLKFMEKLLPNTCNSK